MNSYEHYYRENIYTCRTHNMPNRLTDDNQKIVIFDDFVCERNQQPLIDYFIQGRHKNCSVIYLSQSYYKTPKNIRLNCSHFCVYEFPSNNEVSMICRENNVGKEQYKRATKNPFSFLFIDKSRKIRVISMKSFKNELFERFTVRNY